MNIKIPVYPRVLQPSERQPNNFLILLFPGNSITPLIQSEQPTREAAEKVIRNWLELEPFGKGEIYEQQ